MRLDEIIRGIQIADRRGYFDADISSIAFDSRKVTRGTLFVALRGARHDGHAFIHKAIEAGASSVLAEEWTPGADGSAEKKANVVLVPDARRALALAAANFHQQPSRKLLMAGVTGTNGKTTVTYILESIIRAACKRVGVIGTVDCRWEGKSRRVDHTTPDPIVLNDCLARMVADQVSHVVMEVSSHALKQRRVAGVNFKVAGFTNLTQDHLDYHADLEDYFAAKSLLFEDVLRKSRARGRMAVVNVDDARGLRLLELWAGKALRVSLDSSSDADVVALEAAHRLTGTRAVVRTPKGQWELTTHLVGRHNLSNTLVAVGMALAMGFSRARILRGLEALERVPGRLERVPNDENKAVFVDYAHTPDALTKVLESVRPLIKGRLVVVFGCGGDRDRQKREPMGAAVAAGADLAVITNDNPRSEPPEEIALAAERGLTHAGWRRMEAAPAARTYRVELDRRAAIRLGVDWLGPEDALVIAGKGHESYQIIGDKKLAFDDREEARRYMAGLPPPPPLAFDDQTSEVEAGQVVDTQPIEPEQVLEEEILEPEVVEVPEEPKT